MGIKNDPTPEHKANIEETIKNLLNPFRAGWEEWCNRWDLGDPRIRISSGYRNPQLNDAVKGSKASAHPYGFAADTIPYNGNMKEYRKFAIHFLKDKVFDQCIFEMINAVGAPQWIHLGWKRGTDKAQRKEFLETKDGKTYTKLYV